MVISWVTLYMIFLPLVSIWYWPLVRSAHSWLISYTTRGIKIIYKVTHDITYIYIIIIYIIYIIFFSTEYEDSYLFGFMKKINISNELTNWTWRDKSTTTWKNMPWNSGQPDEHRSLEACGVFHINSGNWSDSADDFRKYICKRGYIDLYA